MDSPTTKIAAVETLAVRLPRDLAAAKGTAGTPNQLVGEGGYRWSRDYPALYSVNIETALVKVTLEDGRFGWGEAQAPLAPEVACTIVDRLLRPVLQGEPFDGRPESIAVLWDRMYSTMRVRGQTGGFMLDAISGVDLALWDLAGKIANQPVSALLAQGCVPSRVPAYLSGLSGDSIQEKVNAARGFWRDGFRIFKLYYESNWPSLLSQIDALKLEFNEEIRIGVDALWHLDSGSAVARARELDTRGILWLECPLLPEDLEGHSRLAKSIRTPLALGESYRTRHELAPFFLENALGFVQPDLGRSGITEGVRIAAMAAKYGVDVVPHVSIALGPQIAAAIHFSASLPNCGLCEYNPRVLEVANSYLREPIAIENSGYVVPRAPGLGIDLDDERIRRSNLA